MERPTSSSPQPSLLTAPIKAARLTVVDVVYHQGLGDQPTSVESRFGRWLNTDEQPYHRKIKVTTDWMPLDLGWLGTQISMLVLMNEEGRHFQVYPTPKERALIEERIVEIGIEVHDHVEECWLIPPGESIRAQPVAPDRLRVRCRRGEARCVLTLFPS